MLASQILEAAAVLPQGTLFGATQFLDLGRRNSVDQALRRLHGKKRLLKVAWGSYTLPIATQWGDRPPSIREMLVAIGQQTGERIAPSLAATACTLGLTQQLPSCEEWLTSGRARTLRVGRLTATLMTARPYLLEEGMVGQVFRALEWAGPEAGEQVLAQLEPRLSAVERARLLALRSIAPCWMAQELSSLAQCA